MKVLQVINNLGSGGAEKLIEEMVPLLISKGGIEVEVLLLTDENNVFDKTLKNNSVKINVISSRSIYSPLNVWDIKNFIIKGNYDIIHVHLFPAFYWVSLAIKLLDIKHKPKVIFTEHSTHNKRRDKGYFKLIDKYIYSSFDKIISISEKTQHELIKWINPKQNIADKFIVIENGINLNKFVSAKPYEKSELNPRFNKHTKLLCMVGRFSEQKDQKTVIQAMELLPKDVHLLLIGEGKLKEQNENLAIELGLKDRIHFLGFRIDVNRILKTSDIVILSSKIEGFGLAAVEGMAAGKPVIASNVPGLSDIVEGAGLLFNPGNAHRLAILVNSLLTEDCMYKKISSKCFEKAKLYDINIMAKKYISIYKELKYEK